MWLGAELVGKRFDPFGVDKHFRGGAVRGFHPRLMILFPCGEPGSVIPYPTGQPVVGVVKT